MRLLARLRTRDQEITNNKNLNRKPNVQTSNGPNLKRRHLFV